MARSQTVSKIRPYYYYLSLYVALPLAYIVTGRIGLLLAVPPGYATAVFMPAGLAVGSFFLAGSETLVGTFVGSFLLNIWIDSDSRCDDAHVASWNVCIGLGLLTAGT